MIKRSREEMQIISKIVNCKNKLRSLDYLTNKYVEGELSEERWEEVKAQRKAWRAEINELEPQLRALRTQLEAQLQALKTEV